MELRLWKQLRYLFRVEEDDEHLWLTPFIVFSLLLHLLLLLVFLPLASRLDLPEKQQAIEVLPLIEDGRQYRLADIPPPADASPPKSANLVGLYDSSAREEQIAYGQRLGDGGKENRPSPQQKQQSQKKQKQDQEKPLGDKLFTFNSKSLAQKQNSSPLAGGQSGDMQDYFPDYRRGDRTYLNVLRYPNVDYFMRLKRAFRTTFNPVPALRSYFSSHQITGGSVEVVMGVSVDASGNLSELFIFQSSGIPGYDQESMRTVRASAPFSAPPKEILGKDGMLRMSWTFTTYL